VDGEAIRARSLEAPQPQKSSCSALDEPKRLPQLLSAESRALLVEKLEGLVERLREAVERERVETRDALPVQLESLIRARDRTDARDVAVVELDELHRLAGASGLVVVRLEEGLRVRRTALRALP
jgi:hypothetical protein